MSSKLFQHPYPRTGLANPDMNRKDYGLSPIGGPRLARVPGRGHDLSVKNIRNR